MSIDADTPPRLGLVLSGGGARGAFQVGVYERLLRDPRFATGPTVLSGTSAGAINVALIAAGRTPSQLLRFWSELGEDPPVVANEEFLHSMGHELLTVGLRAPKNWLRAWRSLLRHARDHMPPRPGSVSAWALQVLLLARFDAVSALLSRIAAAAVFDTNRLRRRLTAEFGGEDIPVRDGVRLAINAIDAQTGRVVRFVERRYAPEGRSADEYEARERLTVDMVVASASIPILFPPVPVAGHLLWDGGVLVNTPLAPMIELGADRVITVLVTEPPDPTPRERFANLGDAIERVADTFLENTYNVDRKLLLERNNLAGATARRYRAVTLYEPIRPLLSAAFTAGSYLDFGRDAISRMVDEGRRATESWLSSGPVADRLACE